MEKISNARLVQGVLALSMIFPFNGNAQNIQWTEDVKLYDGSVITVTQKKLCQGGDYKAKIKASCLARDAWVYMNLSNYSKKEILWHENLDPMIINIFDSKLYIVGWPPTTLEFRKYGAINPPYIGFVWTNKHWHRISFSEIPKEIYQGNMIIESIPKTRTDHVSLARKSVERDGNYRKKELQIDPGWKMSAY